MLLPLLRTGRRPIAELLSGAARGDPVCPGKMTSGGSSLGPRSFQRLQSRFWSRGRRGPLGRIGHMQRDRYGFPHNRLRFVARPFARTACSLPWKAFFLTQRIK